jgi:signal peptidase I
MDRRMKNKASGYKQTKAAGGLRETIRTVIYAVAIAICVRTFAYEPFNIPSGSMKPTLLVGDYLFVSKFSYGYSRYSLPFGLPLIPGRIFYTPPQRGDVIVFKQPANPSIDFIKRVIGLPGDKVQIMRGTIYINDVPVKRTRTDDYVDSEPGYQPVIREGYIETLPNGVTHEIALAPVDPARAPPAVCNDPHGYTGDPENTCPFVVPADHFFMMGDNRDNSADSRVEGSGVGMVPKENLVGRAQFIFFSVDGSADWWEIWKWPFAVRYDRLFKGIR